MLREEAIELRARLEKELGGDHRDIFIMLKHTPFETDDVDRLYKEVQMLGWEIKKAKKILEEGLEAKKAGERNEGRKGEVPEGEGEEVWGTEE